MPQDFDRARESVWGTPGFMRKQSTISSSGFAWVPQADYIIETIKNNEGWMVFMRWVGPEGSGRMVLPGKVVEAMYRQYRSLIKESCKRRAQTAAETRKAKLLAKGDQLLDEAHEPGE